MLFLDVFWWDKQKPRGSQGEASHPSLDPHWSRRAPKWCDSPHRSSAARILCVRSVSFTIWKQTQAFYCFVLKLSGFSWLQLWKTERFICSEEKLLLAVSKCTGDAGKLNSQVGVRHFWSRLWNIFSSCCYDRCKFKFGNGRADFHPFWPSVLTMFRSLCCSLFSSTFRCILVATDMAFMLLFFLIQSLSSKSHFALSIITDFSDHNQILPFQTGLGKKLSQED